MTGIFRVDVIYKIKELSTFRDNLITLVVLYFVLIIGEIQIRVFFIYKFNLINVMASINQLIN